jgi:Uma2 family endonuclease
VPVPDLLYVSYDRLSRERLIDEACPVAPELVIEIISPDRTFGQMSEKATDYLNAGVAIVWVVDPRSKSVTIFYSDRAPQTKKGDGSLADSHLQDLQLTPQQIFHQAGLA